MKLTKIKSIELDTKSVYTDGSLLTTEQWNDHQGILTLERWEIVSEVADLEMKLEKAREELTFYTEKHPKYKSMQDAIPCYVEELSDMKDLLELFDGEDKIQVYVEYK